MAENKVTLNLDNVSKSFAKVENDEVTHALNEISLTMHSGEFISLVGLRMWKIYDSSSCGRTDFPYYR